MNLDRSLLFSWIEEDNIQRAYFRVRPLLTLEGDVRAEAEQLWPNEGCLRIVPDRNEQHTFKVRMRTLGSFCVVDLTDQPAEASKIRTNKNFRPDRGEANQYILYSDTVHELPEHTFYQIVDEKAENYAAACEKAVTPLFYIRQEDTLYGPLRKDAPAKPAPAAEAAGMLFEVPCPDGVTRAILCMEDAPAAEAKATEKTVAPAAKEPAAKKAEDSVKEPAAKAPVPAESREKKEEAPAPAEAVTDAPKVPAEPPREEEALPIGKTLNILDKNKGFDETLQQLDKPVSRDANLLRQPASTLPPVPETEKNAPLSGTPLVRTPLRTAVQQPKNHVQEVVANQWSVGKYEPPAQSLPNGTAMRRVENPVEKACSSLRSAWHAADARGQLVDFILSLDGIHAKLEPRLCKDDGVTMMQRVLRDRLQDLEAERLTALCELDRAHRDVDAYKQELLSGMAGRIQRETGHLEAARAEQEKQAEALRREVNALIAQRDALVSRVDELQGDILPAAVAKMVADAQMLTPSAGIPLRMAPVSGVTLSADELIERLTAACAAFGHTLDRNSAIAALVLMAVSPRIGVACPTPAPLATMLRNIAGAFGWQGCYAHQIAAEQKPAVAARPENSTPAVLATSLANYAPLKGVNKLLLSHSAANLIRNAAYDACQWPVYLLPSLPFVPTVDAPAEAVPVSQASFTALLEKTAATEEEIAKVIKPVLTAALPLSGDAYKDMIRFVSICCGMMEGGLPVAVDWAILLWLTPMMEHSGRAAAAFKATLDEYPLSLAKMS